MDALFQDLRFAIRSLAKRPGFTAVVIVTLALGIGANTAIFSVVNGVLFKPLPYRDADRLALVWYRMSASTVGKAPFSGADFADFQRESRLLEEFAGAFPSMRSLTGDFEPEQVRVGVVTGNLFQLLGVEAELGRFLIPEDGFITGQAPPDGNAPPPPGAVVLSHGLWQRRFGGDEQVIGQDVRLDGFPMTIVGVTPPEFKLLMPAGAELAGTLDAWMAIRSDVDRGPRDAQFLTVLARLRVDATWEQAQAEMDALATRLREEHEFHRNVGLEIDVVPMREDVVGHVEPVLITLLGAVGFVLLIACANVANLMLLRAQAREKEMAIRSALGCGRGRIVRQMLTEGLVFAVLGGAAGVLLASGGIELLIALRPDNLPRLERVGIDGTVLTFAIAASVLASLLFGAAPAAHSSKPDLTGSLHERHVSGGAKHLRVRHFLVVTEVALSLVLLVGAGLMLRTFVSLQRVRPGFEHENVITTMVALPRSKYPSREERVDAFTQLSRRLAALPGVQAVGGVIPLPLAGGTQNWFGPYSVEEANEEEWSRNEADYRPMLPGYFKVMGTQLLAGRSLTDADATAKARDVVVIDDKMAGEVWPGEDPIGKRLLLARPPVNPGEEYERFWAEVVGVVEHIRYDDLSRDSRATVYFPWWDWGYPRAVLTVKTSVGPAGVAEAVRGEIKALDPDIPAGAITPLTEYVKDALAPARFVLILIAIFGAVALLLASVGLYGVIAYAVRGRTHEFGIRMAFGAESGRIVRAVLKQGVVLAAMGVGAGLVGAFFLTRTISGLLFGVTPTDPVTFGAISVLLIAIALVACYVPARRATRVDPLIALRSE
jgi:predicted permease